MADLFETLKANGQYTSFIGCVEKAGLVGTLKDHGPWTVFVPTNATFSQYPADKLKQIQEEGDKLSRLVQYHIVPGFYTAQDLLERILLRTMQGLPLFLDSKISLLPDREKVTAGTDEYRYVIENQVTSTVLRSITVNGANIVQADQRVENGIFHVIDQVLAPKLLML